MLYTITFKSGAQQLFDLDAESVASLLKGFEAVHGSRQQGTFTQSSAGAGIYINEVVSFGPYVSMAQRYTEPSTPSEPSK